MAKRVAMSVGSNKLSLTSPALPAQISAGTYPSNANKLFKKKLIFHITHSSSMPYKSILSF
jgi:hypothetical protein